MVKIDLKSAFWMVLVRQEDWELLAIHWQDHYYDDTCLPFGCTPPHTFSINLQMLSTGF